MAGRWATWGLAALTRRLDGDRAGGRRRHRPRDLDDRRRGSRSRTRSGSSARATGGSASRSRSTSRPPSRTCRGSARCWSSPRATRRSSGSGAGPHETYPDRRAGRARRAVALDGDRPARPLRPAAGERRPRRHPLVPASASPGGALRVDLDRPAPGLGDARRPPPTSTRRPTTSSSSAAPGDHRPPRRRPPRPRHGELRPGHARAVRHRGGTYRWTWTLSRRGAGGVTIALGRRGPRVAPRTTAASAGRCACSRTAGSGTSTRVRRSRPGGSLRHLGPPAVRRATRTGSASRSASRSRCRASATSGCPALVVEAPGRLDRARPAVRRAPDRRRQAGRCRRSRRPTPRPTTRRRRSRSTSSTRRPAWRSPSGRRCSRDRPVVARSLHARQRRRGAA